MSPAPRRLDFDVAPWRLSGRVYGALLNHRPAPEALGAAAHQAPHMAPPQAPVLCIKPRNTLAAHRDAIAVPADAPELELGATLGIVLGRTACRVDAARALEHVAGYTIAVDISVPHEGFYRPAVRFRARDGFCPIGPAVVPRRSVAHPDALGVRVHVDGKLAQETSTAARQRPVARLLADVSAFMTLFPGDVLLLGAAHAAPRVRAGQSARVEIQGLGCLENHFVHEFVHEPIHAGGRP